MMPVTAPLIARPWLLLTALLAWVAVVLQLVLFLSTAVDKTTGQILGEFFRYFTILTNLLVAVSCTVLATGTPLRWFAFFNRVGTLTAITLYITIVGLVYNLVLRQLWSPEGWGRLADEMLHTLVPVVCLLVWVFQVPKGQLQKKQVFPWLWYPLVYLGVIAIGGRFDGFYPYPFINVTQLGYTAALVNALLLAMVFLLFGFLFIIADKRWGRLRRTA